uniref:Ion transport domain-containing protein n=1 Tax=Electrophorus electricus TaxID=8005 RepID=A0A4W4GLV1_ELEEL
LICLCIFTLDVAAKSYLIGWDEFCINKWLIGYVLIIAASVIDWAITVSMLCHETIRVRRLIRPFFLLQNSSLMKKTLKCIKRTLPEIDKEKNGEWEAYFRNLPRALSSLLVLLTTANNPDGTYILMNLLTAIIYNQFRGYLLLSVQTSIIRRRLGIRAAFEVLCCQGPINERVHVPTLLEIMRKVKMKSYYRQAIMKAAEQVPGGFIDGEAFQRLFDELDKDIIKEHPLKPEYRSPVLQWIQKIGSHYYLTVVGNVVALANVLCISTILVLDSEKIVSQRDDYYMEVINCTFILYYLIEMVLKMIGFGWKGYLSYRNNIFDGVFTVLLLGLQISIFKGVISMWEMVRLVNMFIVFRFLRVIPEIKLMALVASTLVDLVKNLRAFAGILVVVYYVYAIIGMWLFHGAIPAPAGSSGENSTSNFTMECGSYEQLEYWPNNFDDFASSLVLLYDVMVVNNWQVFMDAYTRYTTEWSKLYFVSWWLTSSVMWVNLFVALILENFTYKWDKSHALSVSDVERMRYETTVQLMFREHVQEPTEEELLTQLRQHRHLHLSR